MSSTTLCDPDPTVLRNEYNRLTSQINGYSSPTAPPPQPTTTTTAAPQPMATTAPSTKAILLLRRSIITHKLLQQPEFALHDALGAVQADPTLLSSYIWASQLLKNNRSWDQALVLYQMGIDTFTTLKNDMGGDEQFPPHQPITGQDGYIYNFAGIAPTRPNSLQSLTQLHLHEVPLSSTTSLALDMELTMTDIENIRPPPPSSPTLPTHNNNNNTTTTTTCNPPSNHFNYNKDKEDGMEIDSFITVNELITNPEHDPIELLTSLKTQLITFLDVNFITTATHTPHIPPELVEPFHRYRAMTDWLNSNGAKFPALTIKHFTDTHRGVYNISPIREQDTICFIPEKLIITSQTARSSAIGEIFSSFQIDARSRHSLISFYLLHELLSNEICGRVQTAKQQHPQQSQGLAAATNLSSPSSPSSSNTQPHTIPVNFSQFPHLHSLPTIHNTASFFKAYLDILPTSFETIPLFFNGTELALLSGSFTFWKIGDRCKSLFEEYNHIIDQLVAKITNFFAMQIDWDDVGLYTTESSDLPVSTTPKFALPQTTSLSSSSQQSSNPKPISSQFSTPQHQGPLDMELHQLPDLICQQPRPILITPHISLASTNNNKNNNGSGDDGDGGSITSRPTSPSTLEQFITKYQLTMPLTLAQQSQSSPQQQLNSSLSSSNNSNNNNNHSPPLPADNPWIIQLYILLGLNPPSAFASASGDQSRYPQQQHDKLQTLSHSPIKSVQSLAQLVHEFVTQVIIPFSFEQFVWGRMCVITRIFGITIGQTKTDGLVPYCDMLNHKLPRETRWNYDNSQGGFVIVSLLDRPQGGIEIYDSYGKKCNNRFFINYGFTLPENVDNEAVVSVSCDLFGVDKWVELDFTGVDFSNPLSTPTYSIISPITNAAIPLAQSSIGHDDVLRSLQRIDTFPSIFKSLQSNNDTTSMSSPQSSLPASPLSSSPSSADNNHNHHQQQQHNRSIADDTKRIWPHELASKLPRDRFLGQKLAILGIDWLESEFRANPAASGSIINYIDRDDHHITTPGASSSPMTSADWKFNSLLAQTDRHYQVPANPMDPKTIQFLSYLRFIHLTPEQIIDLRKYQVQNNLLSRIATPSSTSIIYSAVPISSPPQQQQQQHPYIKSNNNLNLGTKEHFLNLDNVVLISLENETSVLKLLIYITHYTLSGFTTTFEQDVQLLNIHHRTQHQYGISPFTTPPSHLAISDRDLFDYFTATATPFEFVLNQNQLNAIIQRRGEKIVLQILCEFAFETLTFIRKHEIAIEQEVFKKRSQYQHQNNSTRHNSSNYNTNNNNTKPPTTLNQGRLMTTAPAASPTRPSVRELLARRDCIPPGPGSSSSSSQPQSSDHQQQPTSSPNQPNSDYKYSDLDDTGKVVGEGEDDNFENDLELFILGRKSEVLSLVAQQYIVFSNTVTERVAKWSACGFPPTTNNP